MWQLPRSLHHSIALSWQIPHHTIGLRQKNAARWYDSVDLNFAPSNQAVPEKVAPSNQAVPEKVALFKRDYTRENKPIEGINRYVKTGLLHWLQGPSVKSIPFLTKKSSSANWLPSVGRKRTWGMPLCTSCANHLSAVCFHPQVPVISPAFSKL